MPAADENFAYLSSGTWSLMGIEVPQPIINEESARLNFTNEGGIEGTTRFLKNITGMWLLEQCRKVWKAEGKDYSYAELQAMALAEKDFPGRIDPDDARFANPESMVEAIKGYCQETGQPVPETYQQTARCIFESLALRYRQVVGYLRELAPFPIEKLHVIGGGTYNQYLMQMAADSLGMPVLTGPVEGTAIGNIMLQAKAAGLVSDIYDMRRIIAQSIEMKTYQPKDREAWDAAYERFEKITK